MKCLILASLSLLLISIAITPAVQAQTATSDVPSNPANPTAEPDSRLAPGTPGVLSDSKSKAPLNNSAANHCGWLARLLLGTPSHAAANPASDPGSRLDTDRLGAPNVSGRHDATKNC